MGNTSGDNLISLLQKVQEEFGYLPESQLQQISKHLKIPLSKIYGVASFYAQFRFTPQGKNKVMVCRGTACHVKGAPRILEEVKRQLGIEEGQTTQDLEYTLETVACLGCCALAPCMTVNNKVYGQLSTRIIANIFGKKRLNSKRNEPE